MNSPQQLLNSTAVLSRAHGSFARVLFTASAVLTPFFSSSAQSTLAAPCKRGIGAGAASIAASGTIEVRSPNCVLRVEPTAVLLSTSDERVLDIGLHAVRNSTGQIFTDNRHSQVNVFDRDGKFLRTLGTPGRGPGEFGGGAMRLAVDDADRLFVRHGNLQWSVFNAAGAHMHSTAAGQQAFGWETTCLSGKGVLVTAEELLPNGAARTYNLGTRGVAVASVPRPTKSEFPQGIACVRGEHYWIGASSTGGSQPSGAYKLELRTLSGQIVRTLTRAAPWFKDATARSGDPNFTFSPSVVMLGADTTGLLLIVAMVPNAQIRNVKPGLSRAARDSARDRALDIYIDVVDEVDRKLLATSGPFHLSELKRSWFGGLFSQSLSGYRREETAETATALRLVNVKLYQK